MILQDEVMERINENLEYLLGDAQGDYDWEFFSDGKNWKITQEGELVLTARADDGSRRTYRVKLEAM